MSEVPSLPHRPTFQDFITLLKQTMQKYKYLGIFCLFGILLFSFTLIVTSVTVSAEPTSVEKKSLRLEEVRKLKEENSKEYQELSPLAAEARSACAVMEAREKQMKFLNAQNNALREEEEQLAHDLKIAGADPTQSLR